MKPVEIEFLLKDHTESGLDNMSGNLAGAQAKANAARSAIADLEKQLKLLQGSKVSPGMDQGDSLAKIEALKKKIAELRAEVQSLEKEFPEVAQAAAKAASVPQGAVNAGTYNGLRNSIQQIAREMPTLAMGPQMFFMAISNNLPVFTDELARARKEYDALVKSGQKGVPVWRQVASSLFSWQTAMTTGIMLLVMHGDKIAEWIGKLFKGADAAKALTDAVGDMSDALDVEDMASKIASFEKLARAYRNLGDDAAAKKRFIEDYREEIEGTGIAVYDVTDADNLFITNSDAFVNSVKQRAMALAGMGLASQQYEKALEERISQRERLERYTALRDQALTKHKDNVLQYGALANATPNNPYRNIIAASAAEVQGYQMKIDKINAIIQGFEDAGNAYIDAANRMSDAADETLENAGLEESDESKAKAEREAAERLRQREEMTKKVAELEARAQEDIADMTVEAMKKGYDKERAAAKNEFEQEKRRIQSEMTERLNLYAKLRAAGAAVPEGTEERTRAIATAQTVKAAAVYDGKVAAIDAQEKKDTEDKLKELLEKYRDYEARRRAIKEAGNKDIAALEKARTEENAAEIDRAIADAKEKIAKGLQEINDEEAQASMKDNGFMKKLFGDYSSMSFDSLKELVSQARLLKSYLAGDTDASGITFISAEQLKAISNSPSDLDKLKRALDRLLAGGTGSGSGGMSSIFKQFENGLASLKTAKDVSSISESIASITGAAADAGEELGNMLSSMGKTEAADAIGGVQQVLGAVSSIGEGFAKGGIVGAIGAAAGEAMKLAAAAIEAENRHQEALKNINDARLSYQRRYNILLLEQNLLLDEAASIFGEKEMQRAVNAVGVYRKAYDEYRKSVSSLSSAEILTGHEKTGLFGWGKGRDVYSSILEAYPELIDANGKLDTAMLQTILDTQTMSDETRAYLENLIELTDVMEDAEQALEDYLSATFGDLGSGIMDSVVAAIDGSRDVLESFADDVGDVFEKLGEQLAYSLFFADEFARLQEELEKIYGSGKSEEEILDDAMNLIDSFYDSIGDNADAAQEWMQEWRRKAAEMGFDLWKDEDGSSSQQGKAGAFIAMSQDQGTKLEGLFTAGQMHWANIDENVESVTAGLGAALAHLARIEENTGASSDSLSSIRSLVMQMIREGIKVK